MVMSGVVSTILTTGTSCTWISTHLPLSVILASLIMSSLSVLESKRSSGNILLLPGYLQPLFACVSVVTCTCLALPTLFGYVTSIITGVNLGGKD